MLKTLKSKYKFLIILNTLLSLIISYNILVITLINEKEFIYPYNTSFVILMFYAIAWFFSLYQLFIFKKIGLQIYIFLLVLGIIMNIIGDISSFGKLMTILSLIEHLVIGSIISLSLYSPVKKYLT